MDYYTMDALLLAGGSGRRFGAKQNKVYLEWQGKPLLQYSLDVLGASPRIRGILLVIRPEDEDAARGVLKAAKLEDRVRLIYGGPTRSASVAEGLKAVGAEAVLIQDGARPGLKAAYIEACAKALQEGAGDLDGCAIAVLSRDTVKITDEAGQVLSTTPRARTWLVQTPQAFRTEALRCAHALYGTDPDVTDDCMLIERAGGHIRLLPGEYGNIKLTVPEDRIWLENGRKEK